MCGSVVCTRDIGPGPRRGSRGAGERRGNVSTMVPRCLRSFRQAVTVMQHSLLTTQGGEGEGGGGRQYLNATRRSGACTCIVHLRACERCLGVCWPGPRFHLQ